MSTETPENPSALAKYVQLAKRLIPWVKLAIVVAIIAWVFRELYRTWDKLSEHQWEFHVGWLVLAGIFYLVAYFPAAIFWRHLLHLMGQQTDLVPALRAYYISQLGKYTPGKAMVIIMRTEMIRGKNVRASCAVAAVFFETFAMMSVGALLAAGITFCRFQDHPRYWSFLSLNVLMLALSVLPTIPILFRFVAKKLGVGKGDPEIDANMKKFRFGTVLYGWFIMGIGWLFFGLCLWCTILGLGLQPESIYELPKYTAISAMSIVLGFVLMLPGGLGAREWVLIQFLGPMFAASLLAAGNEVVLAESFAIAGAGANRAVSILAELAIAAVMVWLPKESKIPSPGEKS